MKNLPPTLQRLTGWVVASLALLAAPLHAAGPFTVTTPADSHAVSPATSATDGNGNISLRSAIEAANAQTGPTTINLPANFYNLTLGELEVAPNGGKTNTILGAGRGTTFVNQTDPTNRVFNVDSNSLGSTFFSIAGVTIQGGHDGADLLGGAGILAGSITSTPKDVLTLTNCLFQNNHCTSNNTREPGGAIQMAGGDLDLTGCTFTNDSSGQSYGGAIFVYAQSVISSLNIANSFFGNDSLTNNSGAGPDGGGAIMIGTTNGSVHTIVNCTFTNNRAISLSGETCGGAIQLSGGTLNISTSTFVNNSATGTGSLGGAIFNDSGTNLISFSRISGNTAATAAGASVYNHGSNLAVTTATNDWWGCDDGPALNSCDTAHTDAAGLVDSPWLFLTNTASPGTILPDQATTLTASVLTNSLGQTLTSNQVTVLLGLPLQWNAGPDGAITASQNFIQASGTATATFTNAYSCNTGIPAVTLDSGASIASVLIQCATAPNLGLTLTDNVGGATTESVPWTWKIHVFNNGASAATFATGNLMLLDNLPNLTYTSDTIANITGISGTFGINIDNNNNLTITASTAVTINPGGSFDINIITGTAILGTYTNPRSGGVCQVDPNSLNLDMNPANDSGTDSVTVGCPVISAVISGSTAICLGSSGVVAVTVTGGSAPYTVTLANGAGSQTGSSPLLFPLSPATTTSFQISSATDAQGCPANNSGTATLTVNTSSVPVITLAQGSILANSSGNQASATPGFAAYAWTITNGIITGPTNLATITYVAGTSNNSVGLGVSAYNACGITFATTNVPVITGFSVHTNVTFTDKLASTTMTMAFDGTNYWSCSGGGTTGLRFAEYGLTGAYIMTNAPGLDFRSLTTTTNGLVYARTYNSGVIYLQTSPGVFTPSGITLTGGSLNMQSSVVLNTANTEFDAMSSGVVSRWDTGGNYLGTVTLNGYGSLAGENSVPENRGLAVFGNFWLTFNGAGILSLWDTNGNRVTELTLPGAGTDANNSPWSFSFCNGKVFIIDTASGTWRAFDLYTTAAVAVLAAEGNTPWNADVAAKILSVGSVPRVDVISLLSTNLVLGQLRPYQSVMVFSDNGFNNSTNMGNALADYLDQGGGVVLQTFAFYNAAGLGLQGRVTSGYLPFTTSATYAAPGGLTLVKYLPSHPLLDGVNTFNGGTSSYQNTNINVASGATLVAQWSNGQPLVGGKQDGAGWFAGLNFFPPSSDARSDFWTSSTDGAKLMANALLWSGKIPPAIRSAPADQIVPVGATATFKVVAAGTSTLGYQWRFNNTNLVGATSATLSFTVTAASSGLYSVVVTNLYGATTSVNASLNPQLRFLPPVVSGGYFSLYLVDVDGSAVAPSRAARVSIYAATNITTPFPLWQLLTNPVVSSGTQLRSDGYNTTGNAQFYRAAETP